MILTNQERQKGLEGRKRVILRCAQDLRAERIRSLLMRSQRTRSVHARYAPGLSVVAQGLRALRSG